MNKNITYKINVPLKIQDVIDVFDSSGIVRPIKVPKRIEKMFANSDLAVRKEYQKKGIGKKLIAKTGENIGESVMLLLLSNSNAMNYYPKVGFEKANNAFIIKLKN